MLPATGLLPVGINIRTIRFLQTYN